jgi:hypothetical protein
MDEKVSVRDELIETVRSCCSVHEVKSRRLKEPPILSTLFHPTFRPTDRNCSKRPPIPSNTLQLPTRAVRLDSAQPDSALDSFINFDFE